MELKTEHGWIAPYRNSNCIKNDGEQVWIKTEKGISKKNNKKQSKGVATALENRSRIKWLNIKIRIKSKFTSKAKLRKENNKSRSINWFRSIPYDLGRQKNERKITEVVNTGSFPPETRAHEFYERQ